MSRPPFSLTDAQALTISAGIAELEAACPLDSRNHRPYVRGFIRLVHSATGRFYGPAIYRRLLGAFAKGRKPSTATLAAEKNAVEAEISTGSPLHDRSASSHDPAALSDLARHGVDVAMARQHVAGGLAEAKAAFYADRLRDAESQLRHAQDRIAKLTAALLQAEMLASEYKGQVEALTTTVTKQADAIGHMTAEVGDMRKFALVAIDDARGETRVWKERTAHLESQRELDSRLLEIFRQKAYQNGADIPDMLKRR